MKTPLIRPARAEDLAALVALEDASFSTDRLSRRSFKRFLRQGPHALLVVEVNGQLAGYSLLLFRRATQLARLYSIAVDGRMRGQGLAAALLRATEQCAMDRQCVFLRLEVAEHNHPAVSLYRGFGYRQFDQIEGYYEDGSTALRLEKRLVPAQGKERGRRVRYYPQTTDFTCGPASLMMAMNAQRAAYRPTRTEELQIWREATTIFMLAGHGGCSPHGLALAAARRGFTVDLHINRKSVPFIESVRDPDKRAVVKLVHQSFMAQLPGSGVSLHHEPLSPARIKDIVTGGGQVIALISTWALNRNRIPHWVHIDRADVQTVYINDPDIDDEEDPPATEAEYVNVPIGLDAFVGMACFGRTRLRCLLVLRQAQSD